MFTYDGACDDTDTLLCLVAALVEPVEHGDRQAAVEAVALGDDFAVAADGFGDSVDRLLVERIGEQRPRQLRLRRGKMAFWPL